MFAGHATVAGPLLVIETSAWVATTVILQLLVTSPDVESWALLVKKEMPAAVGVPVIAPVEALSVSPAGSEPDAMLKT
jgi:hypothetical protein